MRRDIRNGFEVGAVAAFLLFSSNVMADTVVLGNSGWEASWDSSLDPYVEIIVDLVTPDAVFIQKAAEFIQPPGPGGFPSIAITFRQIDANAVSQIVINDEIITNSTGFDWTDFHFELIDGLDAVFNRVLTDGSAGGNGFNTSPFDNQTWSADLQALTVDGFGLGPGGSDAIVPSGSTWFPGGGAADGELYIDVVPQPQAPFTVFTLKETPTPEPASLVLLALGGLLAVRRR